RSSSASSTSNRSMSESGLTAVTVADRAPEWSEDESASDDNMQHANWVAVKNTDWDLVKETMNGMGSRRHSHATLLQSNQSVESESDWEHVLLPPLYLSHSWPIHLCAISASGQ